MNYLCSLLVLPGSADLLAYIDPGTGSLIIQMLIGGLVGGLLALKIFWRKIVKVVKRDKSGLEVKNEGEKKVE